VKYATRVTKLKPVLEKYLKEGVLVDEFILDNIPKLLNVMRDSNVTLRWLMLHTCALSPSKCSKTPSKDHLSKTRTTPSIQLLPRVDV